MEQITFGKLMDRETQRVFNALQADSNFKTIENLEEYADRLYKTYWNKCDIVREVNKAGLWILSNPKRSKKNWKRYLTNWLARK